MMTGEVVFGGVGSGLYAMLLFVLLAVFIAGLMVGRTPEYLGKKIGAREIKLVDDRPLLMPLLVLVTTALAIATKYGAPSIFDRGPAGLLRDALRLRLAGQQQRLGVRRLHRLRAAQRARQRRRATAITFADLLGGLAMLARPLRADRSRRWRSPARSPASGSRPPGPGTMRTDTPTFVVLLIGVILLVALLTFVPALLLGPIVQGLTTQLF